MREYVISELREGDVAKLEQYLTARGMGAGIEHLYWLPCPLLSPVQERHAACGPHECIAMADANQTAALMQSLHNILQELDIAF